jgi:SnoaL-like domain
MAVDALDALICKIECQDLIVRHGAALDKGASAEGIALFVEGTPVSGGPGRPDISLETYWSRPLADFEFYKPRIITNILVTPLSADRAEGTAYVTMPHVPDLLWRYEFCKTDQGWRISARSEEMIVQPPHVRDILAAQSQE